MSLSLRPTRFADERGYFPTGQIASSEFCNEIDRAVSSRQKPGMLLGFVSNIKPVALGDHVEIDDVVHVFMGTDVRHFSVIYQFADGFEIASTDLDEKEFWGEAVKVARPKNRIFLTLGRAS